MKSRKVVSQPGQSVADVHQRWLQVLDFGVNRSIRDPEGRFDDPKPRTKSAFITLP